MHIYICVSMYNYMYMHYASMLYTTTYCDIKLRKVVYHERTRFIKMTRVASFVRGGLHRITS